VAVTERGDEPYLMRQVLRKLVTAGIDVPLVIDTTEPEVLETALKTAPGRCLINSTHLEAGPARADRILALARAHNAAVIILTIDEAGMAKTRQRKLEVAQRIYAMAVDGHGLRPADLVYDTLTFTLATGDPEFADSAVETIEGIRLIKENLPGVLTSLGVSNLSFGLSPQARPVLNSVMLYHCVKAGLDMAIVNPAHITPYAEISAGERELAEDLIFNRRPDALQRYIEYFEGREDQTAAAHADPTEGMSASERLHWRVLFRHKADVEADVDEIIAERLAAGAASKHEAAVETLNTVLLPAMKEVGDKFGAGELILPFVLQSAEVMKKAVAHLETYLEKKEGVSKGLVVLATVYGDVHDIGKNLVKTILSNNGYEVIDLGKQVPAETIIARAVEAQATAIGLSALLVSTSKQMPLIVNELQRRGLAFPVLVGGAAINRRFGRRILQTEDGQFYAPGVFYCKDAFEGLETMDALIDPSRRSDLLERTRREAEHELGRASQRTEAPAAGRSSVRPQPVSLPPGVKYGPRLVREMPLEMVFQHLFKNELFRLSWGAKNAHGQEWERLQAEFEARLEQMQGQARREKWLRPQGVYGFWPCQSDGDDLVLYEPASLASSRPEEVMRFSFPRQPYDERLCLADYFSPLDSGQMDVVAFQVVTVGGAATEKFDALQAAGDYTEGYFVHGLAVQTAEATAEYLHRHLRRELDLPEGQGKRYSWGYPAIPELSDHRKVFDLLSAEKDLGMSLTSAYQLVPEQSTAAVVVFHPQAKYYSVGESRVEQLMK
jgi:5-methyltetrahydrofolate--homocysteine methyltransferase